MSENAAGLSDRLKPQIKLSSIEVFNPKDTAPLFKIKNFEVSAGTKLLIEGPSGMGKTTLLHLIAGLLLPDEGYVFINEQNLRFLSEERLAKLRRNTFGIVFQNFNLLDHLTAIENVFLSLQPSADRSSRAETALARLDLKRQMHVRASSLSLGEKQRVAVARILAARPQIILADEPTSSLDSVNTSAVMESLFEIPGNPTLITVSHDHRIRSQFAKVMAFEALVSQ